MTWLQIADHQKRAAQLLTNKKGGYPRAACSRAYYAAYARVAARAPSTMHLTYGRNPGHAQLNGIIDQLPGVPKASLKRALSRLRLSRVSAYYGVGQEINLAEAKERLRDCADVFREV